MQLVLNEWHQPLERLLVPVAPETEQSGYIAVGRVVVGLHAAETRGAHESTKLGRGRTTRRWRAGLVEEGAGELETLQSLAIVAIAGFSPTLRLLWRGRIVAPEEASSCRDTTRDHDRRFGLRRQWQLHWPSPVWP
jgi:hypothetical protein